MRSFTVIRAVTLMHKFETQCYCWLITHLIAREYYTVGSAQNLQVQSLESGAAKVKCHQHLRLHATSQLLPVTSQKFPLTLCGQSDALLLYVCYTVLHGLVQVADAVAGVEMLPDKVLTVLVHRWHQQLSGQS